jgi:hypothetical protein
MIIREEVLMDNEKLFVNTPDVSLMNHYYMWLCKKIDINDHKEYSRLIRYLRSKEFYYSVPNDINRAEDGKHLRKEYLDSGEFLSTHIWEDEPCSVLEMMVALSRRISCDIMPDFGYDIAYWFWQMIANLGLDLYKNDDFKASEVDEIVKNWLDRSYQKILKTGKNLVKSGNFSKKFVESTEIWYQVMAWLDEFYVEN